MNPTKTPQSVTVRTRMAPSPTGEYHVGHIATLLKNYAYAKKHNGQFILRIEDTDQNRKVEGAVERIMSVIKAYGLDWDEGPDKEGAFGPYTQSERLPLYKEKSLELVSKGKAYYCVCSSERLSKLREEQTAKKIPPKYDQHCLSKQEEIQQAIKQGAPYVIRLKTPQTTTITFTDMVRGDISVQSEVVDDQVLLKSDGFPTYHLAVVVDDHLMNITHIMRGEEWISSTPKHVLLYQAFGWPMPQYAHIPVFLNPDGKGKMSKRRGTVAAQSFLDQGYLPEALLNFFMILGWTPKDQREILTLEEYINEFEPTEISPKSVVFDLKKLDWINGVYIRSLSLTELKKRLVPFLPDWFEHDRIDEILPLISERLVKLSDVAELTSFFFVTPEVDTKMLTAKSTPDIVKTQLTQTLAELEQAPEWDDSTIEQAIRGLQQQNEWKTSQYFMMLRIAVTGRSATPPLFETIANIPKAEIIKRLATATTHLDKST